MARDRTLAIKITGDASSVNKAFGSVEKKSGSLKGALSKVGGAAKLALVGAAAAGVKAAVDLDSAFSDIAKATGASGDALGEHQEAFKKTLGQLPNDMKEVAGAYGAAATLLESETTDAIGGVVRQFADFANVAGGDLGKITEGFSRAANIWGLSAEELNVSVDTFTGVAQAYGTEGDKLARQLQNFGPIFKDLGLNIDETAVLFGEFHAAGIDVTKVGPALKTFLKEAAAEGVSAGDAFEQVTQAIKSAGTDAEASKIAFEAFGSEGSRMASFLRDEGNPALSELQGLVGQVAVDTEKAAEGNATLGEKFREMGNKILVTVAPVLEKVTQGLSWFLDNKPALIAFGVVIAGVFVAWAVSAASAAAATIAATAPVLAIIAVVAGLVAGIILLVKNWDTVWNKIKEITQAVWNWMKAAWDTLFGLLKAGWETLKSLWDTLVGALRAAWDGLFVALKAIWNVYWTVLKFYWDTLKRVWETIVGAVKAAWRGLMDGLQALWDWWWGGLKASWDALKRIWDSVTGALKSAWTTVINFFKSQWDWFYGIIAGAWNWIITLPQQLWGLLQSMGNTITNWVGSAVSKLNPLNWFHAGGTFLPPAGQSEGLAVLRRGETVLAPGAGAARGGSGGGGGSMLVQVVVDGRVLAESLERYSQNTQAVEIQLA